MVNEDSRMLTEHEEILLSQYFDGESGFFTRRRAERLIASNPLAKAFLENLSGIATDVRAASEASVIKADLWSRIENRIEAEERAAFYLGDRRESAEASRFLPNIRSRQAFFGGLSGAAVAAAVLIVVSQPSTGKQPPSASPTPGFRQNALGGLDARPASFTNGSQSTMEVDWMRSNNGSLKLIQNPSGKSATIWVRRRAAFKPAPRAIGAAQATPALIETPHLGIDGQPKELSK